MLRSPSLLALCALALGRLSASAEVAYTITDLGRVHSTDAVQASAINESGAVAGGFYFSTTFTAIRWDGTLHTLAPLAGHGSSGASGINDSGQVAGVSFDSVNRRAVLWTNDVPALLPVGGANSDAYDLNNAGSVVGAYRTTSSSTLDRAFLVEAGASASIDLGTLGGNSAAAAGINNADVVVGIARSGNGNSRAFKWQDTNGNHQSDSGEMVQLSDLGLSSGANSINENGVIAGFVLRANFTREASLWDSTGTRTTLPTSVAIPTADAFDVNSSGIVVGNSNQAVIWRNNGTVERLTDLISLSDGWTRLDRVLGINDDGEIVGYGTRPGASDSHAFLLTPVPEPSTLGLLGGLLLIATARRRRLAA